MKRRTFLRMSATLPVVAAASHWPLPIAAAQPKDFDPRPGTWRTYEMTTRIELLKPVGVPRAWVPLPVVESDYQKLRGNRWSGNAR
ncbi:MAG: transglutaminase, partial [Candidatus Rokuibacteriota bacterium]